MSDPAASGRALCGPVVVAWETVGDPRASPRDTTRGELRREHLSARAAAMTTDRAAAFVLGRRLMTELARELGAPASAVVTSRCDLCGQDHGRPRVDDGSAHVSVAYAGRLVVAAAVARADADAVGVDVEAGADAEHVLTGLAELFAPMPPPTLARWTLLEAAVKADGRGLRVPPGEIESTTPVGLLPGAVGLRLPGRSDVVDAAVVAGPAGATISVAAAGRARSGW